MRNYLVPFAFLASCIVLSCNEQHSGPSATTQKNLDADHGIQHAFASKDFSKIGDYIASDCIDHAGDHGDVKGLDSMKAAFTQMATQFEEKSTLIKELADDEYVMSWSRHVGKYLVAMDNLKAGDSFDMQSMEISKFKDGKVVEHWTMMTPNDVMKMMQGTTTIYPADTLKKH